MSPWRSATFSKACNITKSNTSPWGRRYGVFMVSFEHISNLFLVHIPVCMNMVVIIVICRSLCSCLCLFYTRKNANFALPFYYHLIEIRYKSVCTHKHFFIFIKQN